MLTSLIYQISKVCHCTLMQKRGSWGLFKKKKMIFFLIFPCFYPFFHITLKIELDSDVVLSCETHTTRIELGSLRRLPLLAAPCRNSAELSFQLLDYFFCLKPSLHNSKTCHNLPQGSLNIG